ADLEAKAAVLPREEGAAEAELARAGHERVRVGVGVLEGRRGRPHLQLDEAPHGGDDARLRVHREWDSTMIFDVSRRPGARTPASRRSRHPARAARPCARARAAAAAR